MARNQNRVLWLSGKHLASLKMAFKIALETLKVNILGHNRNQTILYKMQFLSVKNSWFTCIHNLNEAKNNKILAYSFLSQLPFPIFLSLAN